MQEQKFNLKQLQEIIGQITARMTQLHKSDERQLEFPPDDN